MMASEGCQKGKKHLNIFLYSYVYHVTKREVGNFFSNYFFHAYST